MAQEPGPKRTENGMLALVADRALSELPSPDVIVVPGRLRHACARGRIEELLDWIRDAHASSTWTTSVCTGSLLLGGRRDLEWPSRRPRTGCSTTSCAPTASRPSPSGSSAQGKIITAAGVSAGIDMALMLAAEIAGPELAHGIQLGIEYDPEPPFAGGSPRHRAAGDRRAGARAG